MVEAYKVGITIALTNQISRGLMLIQGDLAKTDAQAKKLHATLGQIKKLGLAGAILGGAGYAGLRALDKGYDAAKKYERMLNQFKAVNITNKLGESMNTDADRFARGSNLMGVSATELIGTLRDLHTAVGDYDLAKGLAPKIAQMKYANMAIYGEHGADFGENQLRAMEKIIEMKGGFKGPDAFMSQANMMQKVINGTGGMVKPSDYLQFIKTAGVAGRLLKDEAFYYTMEPLIQEMTGGRVGTGTMSAYNNLAQGKSTVRSAKEMMRIGIVDPKMVEWTKIGTVKQIKPGALKGMEEFTSDPYHWMKDILLPAMKAKGITSDDAIKNELSTIFGNRTGSNLFSLMFMQQDKIEKNMAISKKAMNVDDLVKLAKSSPQGAEMAMSAAWENLKISAGEAIIPIIVPWMLKFSEALRDLGKWINQHPVKFDYLIKGFAGLSAVMVMGGSVLLLTASFKGLGIMMDLTLGPSVTKAVTGIGGLATKLGLLGGAAYGVYDLIVNHQKYADAIDDANPGFAEWYDKTTAGMHDGILKRALRPSEENAVPPPTSSKTTTINTAVNLDGRQIATAVTQHQAAASNAPSTSGSGFDGRMGIIQPSWGW